MGISYRMIAMTSSSGLWRKRVRRFWPRNALNSGRKVRPWRRARSMSLDGGMGGFCSLPFFALDDDDCRLFCRNRKMARASFSWCPALAERTARIELHSCDLAIGAWCRHRIWERPLTGQRAVARRADIVPECETRCRVVGDRAV